MKLHFSFLVLCIVSLVNPCTKNRHTESARSHDDPRNWLFNAIGQRGEGSGDPYNERQPEPEPEPDPEADDEQQERCFVCCSTGKRTIPSTLSDHDSFQMAAHELWKADAYRVNFHLWHKARKNEFENVPNVLSLQLPRNKTDRFEKKLSWLPLIQNVDESKVWDADPANRILKLLFTAYDGNNLDEIERLGNELMEHLISSDRVIEVLKRILKNCGYESYLQDFMSFMKQLWFGTILRDDERHTSGFQHVFVGELRRKNTRALDESLIDGQHNWLRYLYLQTEPLIPYKLKYTGCVAKIKPKDVSDNIPGRVTAIQYYLTDRSTGEQYWRDKGSFVFGTGIGFDFSLYTLTLIARPNEEVTFFLGDCAPAIVVALPFEKRLQTAFLAPWLGGVDHQCPDYIRENKATEPHSEIPSHGVDNDDDEGDYYYDGEHMIYSYPYKF